MRVYWRAYLVVGLCVCAGYLGLSSWLAQDLVYLVVGLSGVVAIMVGVRLHRPVSRIPWLLMAAGQFSWVAGDALYSWYEDIRLVSPFPSWADALYLVSYPLLGGGLLMLIRVRRRGVDVPGLIDSALVTIALGLLSWVFLAGPILDSTDEPLTTKLVSVAYPVADILLLSLLVRLLNVAGSRTTSFRLLVAALGLLLIADTAFAVGALSSYNEALDVLWMASYVLWGAAALHPAMGSLSEPETVRASPFTSMRLVALTAAVLVAPGVLMAELTAGARVSGWAIAASSTSLCLLVVARMRLALGEAVRATRQRDQLQGDLYYQAAHDSLTALPNRAHVLDLIEAALHRGRRSGALVGLLFVDLDYFKNVNDRLGHRAGDDVLREVADRMRKTVRAGDAVGRFGGDEFVVLMETLTSESELVDIADRLITTVSRPIRTGGRDVQIGASVGIALSRDCSTDAVHLLHEADTAAYRAKAKGRGRAEVFDDSLRRELDARAALEAAITAGLSNGEFVLYYQPVVAVASGTVQSYEALIRWQRPGHGLVPPDEFIPVAEKSELICEIDRWVLRQATRQLVEWTAADPVGYAGITVAINVSGRHFADAGIVTDVRAALGEVGLAASRLVLEITETVLIDVPSAAIQLHALRELGVGISIDDFGTGYTSIGQLQSLHVDSLKIDRSFMNSTAPGAGDLIALMINAAHAYGLHVIAEGVEHDHQLALLERTLCDSAQGFLFARPHPPSTAHPGAVPEAPTLRA